MTWRGDVKAPYNFSWFIVNEVAACAHPKTVGEVKWLMEQGIKHILCFINTGRQFSQLFI